jgi:hypothetical protein
MGVRLGGLEPPCSRVSDGRLDRLSYRRDVQLRRSGGGGEIQPGSPPTIMPIRWDRLELPPREPQSRALPVELRTWDTNRRSEEGSNLRGHSSRRRRVSTPVPYRSAITPTALTPRELADRSRAPGRHRPDDLPLTRRALCQLSYRSECDTRLVREARLGPPAVAGAGLEPAADTAYEAVALPLSYPAEPRDLAHPRLR